MKKIKQRIRLFFLPYLVVNTLFLLVYTLIIWYFYIRNGLIHRVDTDKIFYVIPGIISLTLMSVFLTPRLRFAIFKRGNTRGMIAATVLTALTTTIMSVAINAHLKYACASIVHLKNLQQFDQQELSGFYTFETIDIDNARSFHRWGIRGKEKNDLYLDLMVACKDTISKDYNFWILEKRDSLLSNSAVAGYAYKKVLADLAYYLDTINYVNIAYFQRSVCKERSKAIISMLDEVSTDTKQPIVFEPKFVSLEERVYKQRNIVLLTYFGINIFWLLSFSSIRVSTLKLYDHEKEKEKQQRM